jgi:hypothetical protein
MQRLIKTLSYRVVSSFAHPREPHRRRRRRRRRGRRRSRRRRRRGSRRARRSLGELTSHGEL